MAGGKAGFVLGSRPRRYRTTESQKRIAEAAKFCGITKGISREELVDKMKTCIPEYFRKEKEEGKA
jgi:hypothetical protein